MVGEASASIGVLPDYAVLLHGGHGGEKDAKDMVALKVAKNVVKGTEPEARLLYRLMSMLGGPPVPPIEAWPSLKVEPLGY